MNVYGQKLSQSTLAYGTPTPAELKLINEYSIEAQSPESVFVVKMILSSNCLDRDNEAMSDELIFDYAETIIGKSLMLCHQWNNLPVGCFFDSKVVRDGDTLLLHASAFLPRSQQDSAEAIAGILSGIYKYTSIGFFAPQSVTVGHGSNQYTEYQRGPDGEKGEALEGSLCFLGSNRQSVVLAKQTQMSKSLSDRVQRKSRNDWSFLMPHESVFNGWPCTERTESSQAESGQTTL